MNATPKLVTTCKRALVASTLSLGLAASAAAWASTQDVAPAPAPAPPAKASAPVPKKKPAAKKPQAPAAKAANGAVKTGAAVTCEPTRTFVPVQEKGVCTPATPPADGQKFNTLEDIYIPPPEPAKKQ